MIRIRSEAPVDADVVVLGAGPAGASAAWHLVQRGHSVLLVDRATFPRDKVCGDFVGPVALVEAQKMGITRWPEFAGANTITRAALFLDGRALIEQGIPQIAGLPATGRVVRRSVFDEWLFRAACRAGARPLQGLTARAYEVHNDYVEVVLRGASGERRVRGRVLIGADGSGSAIARGLRGSEGRSERRIVALRAYFDGSSGPADRCDLYFSESSFPGYYWLFPTGESTANVGIGMLVDTLPDGEPHLRQMLDQTLKNDARLRERLSGARLDGPIVGWPLQTYDPTVPVVGERVMLAGDAAGLINPLNGEGIQYAMLSGRWAAEALSGADLRDGAPAALSRYAQRIERELRYDMALSNVIVELIRNRAMAPLWLHFLGTITERARHSPRYAAVTGGVLAGLLPAHQVLTPSVVFGTAQQEFLRVALQSALALSSGPSKLRGAAGDAASQAARLVRGLLRHPGASGQWALGVTQASVELAAQVAQHAWRTFARDAGYAQPRVRLGPWR